MTDNLNLYALASLVIRILSLGILLFYIVPKQFSEVLRPKNWLTGLRWQILFLFVFSIVAAIPSVTYQYLRTRGYEADVLRNVASITGNLSNLGTSILLVLIYNYKSPKGD